VATITITNDDGSQETIENVAIEVLSNIHTSAVELGRRGGIKGGPARANALTPERRKEIAQKAANTRWAKKLPNSGAIVYTGI
jgi:hypothetical protein